MSFNNIEIARLRIEEARQNGARDAYLRRILAEQQGEQRVSWFMSIIQRWIEARARLTANKSEADCQQVPADC